MNYSVSNFEGNLLGCFRFMSVSNKSLSNGKQQDTPQVLV